MTGFVAAFWAETLKARRSKVLLLVTLGYLLLPFVGGLFMIILKDPNGARQLGLISTKAQLTAGTADWPTYLGILSQGTAIGGIMLFAVATSWIFGREYADRTAKDLLALPTSRPAIVAAKLTILIVWAPVMITVAYGLCLALGSAIRLPLWSPAMAAAGFSEPRRDDSPDRSAGHPCRTGRLCRARLFAPHGICDPHAIPGADRRDLGLGRLFPLVGAGPPKRRCRATGQPARRCQLPHRGPHQPDRRHRHSCLVAVCGPNDLDLDYPTTQRAGCHPQPALFPPILSEEPVSICVPTMPPS